MLIHHPAFQLPPYILPRDPKKELRPNKPLTRTALCEPVGDFIPSHTSGYLTLCLTYRQYIALQEYGEQLQI
jgi:hypothetical protein